MLFIGGLNAGLAVIAMQALDDQTFAACMESLQPFEHSPFLAIAVSGGADSLALTLFADRWARQRGGNVVGLTVDHGLRSGSAEEARQTRDWLRAHGIDHHLLTWTGEKPRSGLQRRARDARYALLTDWCRQHRCLHLLTAHHREDQAETIAIRKDRQSGETGLAGMAAIRELRGLRLLRPLLGVDKAALEASLRAVSQAWIDDPSNASPAFTRNRLRQEGLDARALSTEAEHYGRLRAAADRRLADNLVRLVRIDPAGFARLERSGFEQLPEADALGLLARLLMTVGGRPYPPRKDALLRLLHTLRDGRPAGDAQPSSGTLACCRILEYRGEWFICRERFAMPPLDLVPGRKLRWENHFTVTLNVPLDGLSLEALRHRRRQAEKTLILKGKTRTLPGAIQACLPAICRDGHVVAIPHLGLYSDGLTPEAINLRFCPNLPLANAPFMPHISR
jgi:tRNA(Ile)-lysidine synthase